MEIEMGTANNPEGSDNTDGGSASSDSTDDSADSADSAHGSDDATGSVSTSSSDRSEDDVDGAGSPSTPADDGRGEVEVRGAVQGIVLDAGGTPVAGATVAVSVSSRPTRDIAAMTTTDGAFRLSGLLPGTYELEARLGRNMGRISADVLSGSPTEVEIRLD
jgi:protocatechuate 3,4-dioxygenase beta subunit